MISLEIIKNIGDNVLAVFFTFVLLASIVLTLKLRFIQIRMLPKMLALLFKGMFGKDAKPKEDEATIPSYKALFTAMSTTIGIGNIVGPAVAVRLGGPGALMGFLVALLLGSATTFAEVTFALIHRKQLPDGSYAGGPMPYLQKILGAPFANLYAITGSLLLVVWCSNQSNTLADIVSTFHVPKVATGLVIAGVVVFYLFSGIQKIGDLAAKIVPIMFILYCSACLWVIFNHLGQVLPALKLMVTSALTPGAIGGAAVGVSLQKMLRWGLAKGTHIGEAGIGTATIPHSQSKTKNPLEQGVISMVSLYSVAIICFLSGLVTIVAGSWNDTSIPLGMAMIAVPFKNSIPFSSLILACSAFLFALGTILGNAYNGGQCFSYMTGNKGIKAYYIVTGLVVLLGSFMEVELIWSITDYFIIPVALPNLIAVLIMAFRNPEMLMPKKVK